MFKISAIFVLIFQLSLSAFAYEGRESCENAEKTVTSVANQYIGIGWTYKVNGQEILGNLADLAAGYGAVVHVDEKVIGTDCDSSNKLDRKSTRRIIIKDNSGGISYEGDLVCEGDFMPFYFNPFRQDPDPCFGH